MLFFAGISFCINAAPVLTEFRTSSDRVIVVYFKSDKVDPDEISIDHPQVWKINGSPAKAISRYIMQANACDHLRNHALRCAIHHPCRRRKVEQEKSVLTCLPG